MLKLNSVIVVSDLLLCDALQSYMKHLQHLWYLTYKPQKTHKQALCELIQSRCVHHCAPACMHVWVLPALAVHLLCSWAGYWGWLMTLCSSLSDCRPAPQTTWTPASSAAAEADVYSSPDMHRRQREAELRTRVIKGGPFSNIRHNH